MIKTYTIFEGTKATIEGGQFTFTCSPDDVDVAYDAIAENIHLINQDQDSNKDLVDFQNADDKDVKTLLDSLQAMNFISGWTEGEN